ncbi:urea transporter [Sporosarcina luteola]|nr:urea transporter [Sporosarcina luteola]
MSMQTSEARPGGNRLLSFFIVSLKGVSQVILIENAVTGFFILAAILTTSIELGIIAFISSIIGTLVGQFGGADPKYVHQGLFGYNSVLTGLAVTLFLTGPFSWAIALFGAMIAAIFTAAMMNLFKNIGLPVLTFPFILLTWIVLLASFRLKTFNITNELVPQDLSHWKLETAGHINWWDAFISGIGQIFFLQGSIAGILLFFGLFWAGWRFGFYAIAGNVVAVAGAFLLGGEHTLIDLGLYGYNAILTVIAVGIVFKEGKRPLAPVSATIASFLTVPLIASVDTWLLPFGLSAFTMPFVISTWLFVGARKVLNQL